MNEVSLCPCGSGLEYATCCGLFHSGGSPKTAEQVVRARYSAFVLKDIPFLIRTFWPEHLPEHYAKELLQSFRDMHWTGLNIIGTRLLKDKDNDAMVEFSASFVQKRHPKEINGKKGVLHEIAFFKKKSHDWFYSEGILEPERAMKKNELCWCGSGKKYKRCHLKIDERLEPHT